jgi:hypothetical protein
MRRNKRAFRLVHCPGEQHIRRVEKVLWSLEVAEDVDPEQSRADRSAGWHHNQVNQSSGVERIELIHNTGFSPFKMPFKTAI